MFTSAKLLTPLTSVASHFYIHYPISYHTVGHLQKKPWKKDTSMSHADDLVQVGDVG